MMVWKMILLFQGCILRFHVNLPGCTNKYIRVVHVEKLILSSGISQTTRTSPPQKNSSISWWFNHRVEQYLSNLRHVTEMFKVNWLVVSTHLKNISQVGHLPQIGVKIKNIWNHHLVNINKNICETNAETAFCEANPSFYDIGSPALIHRRRHPTQ